ncbi:MAG TPA: hypothetical protein VE715_18925 [Blastocatellia bacterium]|nr:hypothetical protein [Blastocatellia bacterium]
MNAELNGLIIEPEVIEQGEIGGTTEVTVDLLYRSGENSITLMIELEGMCKSLVDIIAEEGHVYMDIYRDWSQEQPERIEICRYYFRGEEPGQSGVAPEPIESNVVEAAPENVEENKGELHDDHQSAQ